MEHDWHLIRAAGDGRQGMGRGCVRGRRTWTRGQGVDNSSAATATANIVGALPC